MLFHTYQEYKVGQCYHHIVEALPSSREQMIRLKIRKFHRLPFSAYRLAAQYFG